MQNVFMLSVSEMQNLFMLYVSEMQNVFMLYVSVDTICFHAGNCKPVDVPIFSGLQVTYSDGHTEQYAQLDCTENYEFTLLENERITDARVRSGWLVDRLTFKTNLGNTYGPYGGPGGRKRHMSAPKDLHGRAYLAWVSGGVVRDQGALAITRLKFHWAAFKFDSADNEELIQIDPA